MITNKQDHESAERAQTHKGYNDEPVTTFKARADVVQLFFNVKYKKGGLIPNLPKENFDVLENGNPQVIKYFAANSNLPLTLGILIDSSGSQKNVLDMEKQVGGASLQDVSTEKHAACVISLDAQLEFLQ